MSKFHSILFLLESKNHCAKALYMATVQKYDAVSVQCSDSVSPVPPFSWGPSWDCGHYLVFKTKPKEESWIVVVPSFSGSFKTLVSHTVGD